jgi:predicted ArsR family transcriptional regulator
MAECQQTADGYLLVENHCPICVAATTCQGLCRAEQEVFQQALGNDVSVERTEHIIQGDRRCAYRIALKCVPEPARSKTKRRDKT